MSIHLRSQRGAIGVSWLATRVREEFEKALGPAGRAKGKQAARGGSVQWLDIHLGRAEAQVRPGPAHTEITIGPWHAGDVEVLSRLVAAEPSLLLTLMDGSFGAEQEARLEGEGVGLLPGANGYVSFDCSCSTFAVCPHVYAVAYCVVERVDEQPADYLRLLGIDPDTLGQTARDGVQAPSATHPTSSFTPSTLDPTILHDLISDDAARVFTEFYSAAPHTPPANPMRKDPAHDSHAVE